MDATIVGRVLIGDGCWLWPGAKGSHGYGSVTRRWADGKRYAKLVHRYMYEHLVGPIPPKADLDHSCGSRLCVRPDHLTPRSRRDHMRRHAETRETCAYGHPWDEENTHWYRGNRMCRACGRRKAKAYLDANREQVNARRREARRGRS